MKPWSFEGMKQRREFLFESIRHNFRPYVSDDGIWKSPPGVNAKEDPRIFIEVALPYLAGDASDRALARKLLRQPSVKARVNNCAFCNEYSLALVYGGGDLVPEDLRHELIDPMKGKLIGRYATKDLQHHGFNDNHVTMATSTLVLGGQYLHEPEVIEQGRMNLLNFRDTLMRRGFIHEMNDCYIVHTLYSTAIVGQYAEDPEIRQLAQDIEARIWIDFAAHYHPNLGRKAGPSARDYTGGRLWCPHFLLALWGILGDAFQPPLFDPKTPFREKELKDFRWRDVMDDQTWNMGFIARMMTHGYTVPDKAAELFCGTRQFPFTVTGTHETGNVLETIRLPDGNTKSVPSIGVSGGEIVTTQYQERDWAIGVSDHRMIGNCPNNNFEVVYRKKSPMQALADQGMWFCSFTVNDKNISEDRDFYPVSGALPNHERTVAWFDNGLYAGFGYKRSAIMLYRARISDHEHLHSLSTTLVYPLCFGNHLDHLYCGDQEVHDFTGESDDLKTIYAEDGNMFVAFRFLMPNPRFVKKARIRFHRNAYWGMIDAYVYDGSELSVPEPELARIGGGFYAEVGTKDQFSDLKAFRKHVESIRILDDQVFAMRQVRVHHPEYLLAMRYDSYMDKIMYRAVNNRTYVPPQLEITGVDLNQIPFMTGDVSKLDGFDWAVVQAARKNTSLFSEEPLITPPPAKQ